MELYYIGGDSLLSWLRTLVESYRKRHPDAALRLTRVDESAICQDEPPLCVLTDDLQDVSARVVVRLGDLSHCRQGSQDAGVWRLWRGEEEEERFSQLVCHLHVVQEHARVHQLVVDPVSHDFRGAIGVVGLVAEVLKANPDSASLVKKLLAARLKIEALIGDLQVLCIPHFLAPLSDLTGQSQKKLRSEFASQSKPWANVLDEANVWFQAAHRDRTLTIDPPPSGGVAPPHALIVLRGLLDVAARITERNVVLHVSLEPKRLRLDVAGAMLSPRQKEELLALGSRTVLDVDPQLIPFRLGLSLAAARKDGATLEVGEYGSELQLVYTFVL